MNPVNSNSEQEPLLTFGIVADVQYCDADPVSTRNYRNSLEKLSDAIDDLNNSGISFIISMGDLIDRNYESYEPVLNILQKSDNKIYHVLGNHDYSVKRRYKKGIPALLTGDQTYYSFVRSGFRFIILNTCDISTYNGSAKSLRKAEKYIEAISAERAPNGFDWNGAIGTEQMNWFKAELDTARANKEKVLVFSHHTVEPLDPHCIYNRQEVLDLVSGYDNILAWFSGHNHAGNYGNFNYIHFVTLRAMVETPDRNAYSVIELYNNKLWIKGRGREKSQILAY